MGMDPNRRRTAGSFVRVFLQALTAVTLLPMATSAAVAAGGMENGGDIRAKVRAFLTQMHVEYGDNVQVSVGYLDSRLKLAACKQEVEPFLPAGGRSMGHVTVGVRCPGPKPWTVFLSARVGITGEVLVAKRALRRGELLSARELRSVKKDLGDLTQGYITEFPLAVGKRLKRSAREGQVIAPSMLESPPLIRRGEQVGIVYQSQAFFVRAEGVALADGGAGETIRVRNRSSEKVVDAVVIAASLVKVNR